MFLSRRLEYDGITLTFNNDSVHWRLQGLLTENTYWKLKTFLVMFQKLLLIVATTVCFSLGMYFTYFHRPPVDDILAANLALHGGNREIQSEEDYEEDENLSPAVTSRREWDRWVQDNKYIAIGKIFDRCDGEDLLTLGRVILMVDRSNGGLASKTYLNITLEKDVTDGQMGLECKYNGNDLLSSHWNLCTVEDDMMDDRIINCPMRAGRRKFIKNIKIPSYLPKGRYSTKAWLTDQDNQMICCGFAEFTI